MAADVLQDPHRIDEEPPLAKAIDAHHHARRVFSIEKSRAGTPVCRDYGLSYATSQLSITRGIRVRRPVTLYVVRESPSARIPNLLLWQCIVEELLLQQSTNNGFSEKNFVCKLIGNSNGGELIVGYTQLVADSNTASRSR
jgi:hypothetical protein